MTIYLCKQVLFKVQTSIELSTSNLLRSLSLGMKLLMLRCRQVRSKRSTQISEQESIYVQILLNSFKESISVYVLLSSSVILFKLEDIFYWMNTHCADSQQKC